jgi:hypothetical protein
MTPDERFERARQIADAVLLEGYVLYPYRASSAKNRWRWSFGVLAPRAWSEASGCEPWWLEVQCLVERTAPGAPRLRGRLRFLQARRRTVEAALEGVGLRPVEELEAEGRRFVPWDEGDVREIDLALGLAAGAERSVDVEAPAGEDEEPIRSSMGVLLGRVVRRRRAARGRVAMSCEDAGGALLRVRVRVENVTPWEDGRSPRDAVLAASFLAAHLILSVDDGAFVSLLDPPDAARAAAAACRNVRVFPVLAGADGERDLLLASPIILYDHPRIAPESPGEFFDATEIDELLALRTATLTDAEKREARATDPRAAALVERVERMPPELLERLHGAARELRAAEMVPRAADATPGAAYRPGDRVRLRPGVRRTDAQDLLYAGRVATVREVKRDVDGRACLAVTVDDDPAAELHDWVGRYHHYFPDEVEPLAPAAAAEAER